MKIMVVGGGGREHAIIKKIKENPQVTELYALPGNGGIAKDATCVDIAAKDGRVGKLTNHSGGVLGGISDGDEIVFRAAVKPTPSISALQETVNKQGEDIEVSIKGRHDPMIVPRAVVVVEAMTALTLVDLIFDNMTARMDRVKEFYRK